MSLLRFESWESDVYAEDPMFFEKQDDALFSKKQSDPMFPKKQSDTTIITTIISATASFVIVHYCNNKKKLFIHCLWDAFADDRPSETD